MSEFYNDLPIIEIDTLTEDQLAMLELLGVARVRQTRSIDLVVTPAVDETAYAVTRHIARHHCPIVTWRGKERVVRPDGSLETLNRRADND